LDGIGRFQTVSGPQVSGGPKQGKVDWDHLQAAASSEKALVLTRHDLIA